MRVEERFCSIQNYSDVDNRVHIYSHHHKPLMDHIPKEGKHNVCKITLAEADDKFCLYVLPCEKREGAHTVVCWVTGTLRQHFEQAMGAKTFQMMDIAEANVRKSYEMKIPNGYKVYITDEDWQLPLSVDMRDMTQTPPSSEDEGNGSLSSSPSSNESPV